MRKRSLAECWMWLGVAAVAVAGLYALVPVIGRTPQLKDLSIVQQLFDVALVVHVDLSVLVWFLAMLMMGASGLLEARAGRAPAWLWGSFLATTLATALIALSPLGDWAPVKSNYIPVLHNPLFLGGLGLLAAGIVPTLLPVLITYLQPRHYRGLDGVAVGYVAAAMVALFGLVGYALGARALPEGLERIEHYERLFWAGGHMMQFAYAILAMVGWLALLRALGGKLPPMIPTIIAYDLALLGALASLAGFVLHAEDISDFTAYETQIMIEWGGAGATLMALLVGWRLFTVRFTREHRAYASALLVSLMLFFAGGALGLMIVGQNVTIPAHYHGMITGITQALMGVAYLSLPRFGYASVAATRLAFWQPIIYGAGQLMHIGGLAYCGGYGVLRKTAGGFEQLAPDIKVALGVFGMGGLLAISGGVMFVLVMLRARRG